jgi:hypothetical protein
LQLTSAGFLSGLLFDPEAGSDIFLRNVRLSPTYKALNTEERTLHCHNRKNLKFNKTLFFFAVNKRSNILLQFSCAAYSRTT